MKSDVEYKSRILKYSKKIVSYMIGVSSYNDFSNDEQKIDAVILNLEQIG